jgi:AraC-like DNA-binding protein
MMKIQTFEGLRQELKLHYTQYRSCEVDVVTPARSNIHIRTERYPDFILSHGIYHTRNEAFTFDGQLEDPIICMIFHLSGSVLLGKELHEFSGNLHSLNFYPNFKTQMVIPENHHVEQLLIKLRVPFVQQYLEMGDDHTHWFFEQIDNRVYFDTTQHARIISPEVRGALLNIIQCSFQGTLRSLYLESQIKLLLSLLIHEFRAETRQEYHIEQLQPRDIEILHEIHQYVSAQFLDNFSLYSVCRRFGINEFKLKYGFKKLFGTSLMKLVQKKRMAHAREMLLRSDRMITDVAFEVGYSSTANFSKAFRNFYGFAPSAVR